jgi:type II secretory pathway component PulF
MNLPQLGQFTEGLGKMLADGIEIKRALRVAGEYMANSDNRRFAECLRQTLLSGEDLSLVELSPSVPPFYLTILQCGILTGRVPQALAAAAYYIRQVLPVRHTLRQYGRYSLAAYIVCLVTTSVFRSPPSLVVLLILTGLCVLPRRIETLAYARDVLATKLPFVSTWLQQVALLEFFSCLEICYDSTLSVPTMFASSLRAVGNRALRRQLQQAQAAVEQGNSFADALRQAKFIPRGMIADIRVNELCGKLEMSFHGFSSELHKLVEAKLEPVKALAAGWIISFGILLPLMVVLPVFLTANWLVVYLLLVMGYLWMGCLYMAVVNYCQKATMVNCWWNGLRDSEELPP